MNWKTGRRNTLYILFYINIQLYTAYTTLKQTARVNFMSTFYSFMQPAFVIFIILRFRLVASILRQVTHYLSTQIRLRIAFIRDINIILNSKT